jgi:hypothetical protein
MTEYYMGNEGNKWKKWLQKLVFNFTLQTDICPNGSELNTSRPIDQSLRVYWLGQEFFYVFRYLVSYLCSYSVTYQEI